MWNREKIFYEYVKNRDKIFVKKWEWKFEKIKNKNLKKNYKKLKILKNYNWKN